MKTSLNSHGSTTVSVRLLAIALIIFAFFYLAQHWSDVRDYQPFFYNNLPPSTTAISPSNTTFYTAPISLTLSPSPSPSPSPPHQPVEAPSAQPPIKRFGIVDENGLMTDDFEIGEFDPHLVEDWEIDNSQQQLHFTGISRVRVKKFPMCPITMKEYIPCLDNVNKLKSITRGEKFERHCPKEGQSLNCLVPPPKGYKPPIPWPRSRGEVWFVNVPHTRLVNDKGGQNWILREKEKFKFPVGGTQFIHGAEEYIQQISKMVSDIKFGVHTRVVLDVGCGVASFGAFLLAHNVITLSVAPKDVHENQIQFALERGVPAMVAAFATRRLLYPSQAFDLIHCSRCRVDWTRDDGILLLEVNRMLRAGGYFAWAAQPVYKHEEPLQEQWKEMEDLTSRLCWELVKKEGYIAIWRKPVNNICYNSRAAGAQPPLCDLDDDPDNVWYVGLKSCISRLPANGFGANIPNWPARLDNPPDRLQSIQMDAYMSRKELFKAESRYWKEIVARFIRVYRWKKIRIRNVMDMKAGFGGFAATLMDNQIDCWVMNVVPITGPNTLPVIFDRGLIGVMHDWCEPFDTYPRTYDFLHAAGLLSSEQKRCNISTIMIEMDRILRPGGRAYIRDSVSIMDQVEGIAAAMGWQTRQRDTAEGPYASWRVLQCEKRLLRA
ncbi:hypothetical protein ACHQM5_010304 [Ranunculus cassubicifolius]